MSGIELPPPAAPTTDAGEPGKKGPKRTPLERERDLAITARLYWQEWSQERIADHLTTTYYADTGKSLSRQQVAYDLGVLFKRLQASGLLDTTKQRLKLLAQIEYMIGEAIEQWHASKQPETHVYVDEWDVADSETQHLPLQPYEDDDGEIKVGVPPGKKVVKKGGKKAHKTTKTIYRNADPRYGDLVAKLMAQKAALLGLVDKESAAEETFVVLAARLREQGFIPVAGQVDLEGIVQLKSQPALPSGEPAMDAEFVATPVPAGATVAAPADDEAPPAEA